MPRPRGKLVTVLKPCSVLTVALILLFLISDAVPARAQDFFGLFKIFAPPPAPVAPVPNSVPSDLGFGSAPERSKPKAHPRPKPAPAEEAEVKKPVEPRRPGEMDNPVPALLDDSTLRAGDMVMFPDGLRVFTGRIGSRHKVSDFTPLAQAERAVSRETRKLVSNLRPGENVAWSADTGRARGKLADITKDTTTTSSVKRRSGVKEFRRR